MDCRGAWTWPTTRGAKASPEQGRVETGSSGASVSMPVAVEVEGWAAVVVREGLVRACSLNGGKSFPATG